MRVPILVLTVLSVAMGLLPGRVLDYLQQLMEKIV